ncbi:hypothetical protein CPB86DRAFT_708628 [Serendipita vermifera]|nr:hypothetical protein CPB86DRAFT_708628 [Serendipita vermifera]
MYDTVTSETVKQTARDLLTPAKKLIDTLDQLGNIHPFVKVATGVFSVIVTMELKRRENDKKVAALVDTMREMMQVLAKYVDNADGQTLEVDLEPILKNVGAAIRKAGNTIDTYYKQKFLVKFITSSHWEEKFIELAKDFEAKKGKIDFTLSLHVTVTLDTTSETVSQIQVKVDLLLKLFQTKTAEEKQLADVIAGRNVLEDRNALDQAVKFTKSLESSDKAKKGGAPEREKDKSGRSTTDSNATMLISLKTSVNDLIAENNALFELKFESLQSAIERSEQRIITELRAGPHERILHPCWRTFVKARHFVLSLHDYYQDRISGLIKAPEGSPEMTEEEEEAKLDKERWCLQFLTAQYVSDILAAVDEDASGYIKISEANEFTSSIPPDWTLPEWLAFWAQGWHYELITYRYRLAWIWAEMFQVYQTVLPENRTIMRDYLESTPFCSVHNMIVAIQAPHSINPTASGLVEAHMALNEAKLSKILSATRYQIENSDSIQLFFGDASLEKVFLKSGCWRRRLTILQ